MISHYSMINIFTIEIRTHLVQMRPGTMQMRHLVSKKSKNGLKGGYVSVSSKPDHPSRQNPRTIFLIGEFPTPGQNRVQNPHPRAYKNELKPHSRGHFPQLFTINT